MFKSSQNFVVSDLKKQSKFERYGNLNPTTRNNSLSRNFVVITNNNSPKGMMNNSVFNETDGF